MYFPPLFFTFIIIQQTFPILKLWTIFSGCILSDIGLRHKGKVDFDDYIDKKSGQATLKQVYKIKSAGFSPTP
jgi:hypothetical protein